MKIKAGQTLSLIFLAKKTLLIMENLGSNNLFKEYFIMKKGILKTVIAVNALNSLGGMINMIVNPDDYENYLPKFEKFKGLYFSAEALEFVIMTEIYKKLSK